MKTTLQKIFLLLTISTVFLSCGEQTKTAEIDSSWITRTADNYTVSYPSDWDLDTNGAVGMKFAVISKLKGEDNFQENVNLLIRTMPNPNISHQKMVDENINGFTLYFKNPDFIVNETKKGNIGTYQRVIVAADYGENRLQFEQYLFIKEGQLYVLTFSSTEKDFDNEIVVGEKILNSFDFVE